MVLTLDQHIIPKLSGGASSVGRPNPMVVGGFPILLTHKPEVAREKIAKQLAMYGPLPSYRAMLDMEGASGPADIAIVGDENYLGSEIRRLESIGVTHFNGAISGADQSEYDRTLAFLAELAD